MKEGSHKKNSNIKKVLVNQKKNQVDSERKDMEQSTMVCENIVNLREVLKKKVWQISH